MTQQKMNTKLVTSFPSGHRLLLVFPLKMSESKEHHHEKEKQGLGAL